MKPKELAHINKLPKQFRGQLFDYALHKVLGHPIGSTQKEANVMLRFLASCESKVIDASPNGLRWRVVVAGKSFDLVTRRYPSSDIEIMQQVLGNEEYKPIRELFDPEEKLRIIDAGANVGFASIYFTANYPNAEVLCLEIDRGNVAQLKANIELNDLQNIAVLEQALWKSSAYLEIKRDFRDQTECSFYVVESSATSDLQGHDVTHYMRQMKWDFIDLLKIDIEGAEQYLFDSEDRADLLLDSTRVLAIEIHDEFNIRSTIEHHLTRHGFTYVNHGDVTIASRKKPS